MQAVGSLPYPAEWKDSTLGDMERVTMCTSTAHCLRLLTAGVLCASLGGLAAAEQPASRSFAPAPAVPGAHTSEAPISRLSRAQALIDLGYPRPGFDLDLRLSDGHALSHGQRFDVVAEADRPATLVLLNIDRTGTVSILYPLDAEELEPRSKLHETFEVVPPYGTEVLKLFAFRRAPQGLEHWLGRQVEASDPDFDRLLRLLREPGTESAETRYEIVTAGGPPSGGS